VKRNKSKILMERSLF